MKNKLSLILLFFLFSMVKSNAQFDYQSRLLEEFNRSRFEGDYNGIIKNGEELKSVCRFKNDGVDSLLLLQINSFLSIAYSELRLYDKIQKLYFEVENYHFVYEDTTSAKGYFSILCYITNGLIQMHDISKAEMVYNKSLNLYNAKTFEIWRYRDLVRNKIAILNERGRQDEAEELTKEAIKTISNINFTLGMYSDLISHYFDKNNLKDAESTIYEALDLYEKQDSLYKTGYLIDPNFKSIFFDSYKVILGNLSILFERKSDYKSMLSTNEKILQLSKDYSISPRYLSLSMIQLANSYLQFDNIERAIALCKDAVHTIEINYGKESPELIEIFNDYGLIMEKYNFNEALELYLKACNISEKQDKYYNAIEIPFQNISRLYTWSKFINRNPDSSITYAKKSYNLIRKYFPESSETYIQGISDLAYSFSSMNYYDSSLFYHLKAKQLYEKYNYQESDLYIGEMFYLAIDYISNSQNNESKQYFNLWINYWRSFIKKNFYSLVNDIDKADKIKDKFELYDYYAQRFNDQEMLSISFENKIIIKNLKLNHISELKREIKKNKSANDIYLQLCTLSSSEIDQKVEYELKSQLYNLIPIFQQIESSFSLTIKDCKKKLKSGEALIEFGKYNFIYSDEGKKSDFYFVLILRSDNDEIKYVPLGFEEELKKNIELFDNDINLLYQYSYNGLYDFIIRPIINNLKGINCIYFSTTGIINQFNLSALQSESNRSLSESYKVYNISSTSEFLRTDYNQFNLSKVKVIYTYGGIDYGNSTNFNMNSQYINRSGINKWIYLPGTLSEVNFIDSLFSNSKIKTKKLVGKYATESSIYNLQKNNDPYILHIASHGFFLNSNTRSTSSNPLDLSGILFSHANNNAVLP